MRYRHMGSAGLQVSAVSLGGWINFGQGNMAEASAREVIETALELGINFFDLADSYALGDAERQLGRILGDVPRHTLVLSSKVFWPMSEDINDRGLSRKHIMESIEKSLNRLQTDYLDIYFCHRPDPSTPIRESAHAMHNLIERGKVLYWGTSEWNSAQIVEAHALCDRFGWHLPITEQPQYSMLFREKVENEILPVTSARGIGLVTWSPLAMGMLTGKYDEGIPEGSRFGRQDWSKDRFFSEQNREKVGRLKPIADSLGLTRAQLALAWILRHDGVSSVITGATRPEQVRENVRAAEVDLPPETIEQIEDILSG